MLARRLRRPRLRRTAGRQRKGQTGRDGDHGQTPSQLLHASSSCGSDGPGPQPSGPNLIPRRQQSGLAATHVEHHSGHRQPGNVRLVIGRSHLQHIRAHDVDAIQPAQEVSSSRESEHHLRTRAPARRSDPVRRRRWTHEAPVEKIPPLPRTVRERVHPRAARYPGSQLTWPHQGQGKPDPIRAPPRYAPRTGEAIRARPRPHRIHPRGQRFSRRALPFRSPGLGMFPPFIVRQDYAMRRTDVRKAASNEETPTSLNSRGLRRYRKAVCDAFLRHLISCHCEA